MNKIKQTDKGLVPALHTRIESDSFAGQMDMVGYFCPNPECSCKDATLCFYEANGRLDKKLFRITLNYETWQLQSTELYDNGDDYTKIIHEFMMESDDKVKVLIRTGKEKAVSEDILLDDIDYSGLDMSSLVCYPCIYHSSQYGQFLFDFEDTVFLVVDYYCPNPKCKCRDVHLMFHVVEASSALNDPVLVIELKFHSKKYSIESSDGNISKQYAEQLYQEFLGTLGHKGIDLLEERYFRIKKWGKENLQVQLARLPINASGILSFPKIGRNDPCPCGSGKKYKKCCYINK